MCVKYLRAWVELKKQQQTTMGTSASNLKPEEIDEMQKGTNCKWFYNNTIVSPKEIKRLYKRFKKLDKDGNGTISREEFMMIPELAVNPLVKRVISIFDQNGDESVNFKEFISALSVFNSRGEKQEKLECMFDKIIYV